MYPTLYEGEPHTQQPQQPGQTIQPDYYDDYPPLLPEFPKFPTRNVIIKLNVMQVDDYQMSNVLYYGEGYVLGAIVACGSLCNLFR